MEVDSGARGGVDALASTPAGTGRLDEDAARLVELISPAGFENYFRELAPLLAATERDEAAIGAVVARYELDIDFATIPALAEQHHLRLA